MLHLTSYQITKKLLNVVEIVLSRSVYLNTLTFNIRFFSQYTYTLRAFRSFDVSIVFVFEKEKRNFDILAICMCKKWSLYLVCYLDTIVFFPFFHCIFQKWELLVVKMVSGANDARQQLVEKYVHNFYSLTLYRNIKNDETLIAARQNIYNFSALM